MTDNTLKQRINDDVKDAMRARDKSRVGALRLVLAAIKQREVDERIELDDAQVLAVLDRLVKQRRESIEQYQRGNRPDLVQQETYELELIQRYLPKALPDSEIDALIQDAVTATGAASAKDMGKVMALLKPQVQGRADMSAVSRKVKERLG